MKVGNETIYKEQVICANEIINVFEKQKGAPLLIAEMQQGKTGVCIALIDLMLETWKNMGLKYEVIYLINQADNDLRQQTEERLIDADLLNQVKVMHHGKLRPNKNMFDPDLTVDKRLIIVDECHMSMGKGRPFHEFLMKCGINYGENLESWKNKNNYVLSVSATSYAHVIKEKLDAGCFYKLSLEKSHKYYSLEDAKKDNRLFPSEKLIDRDDKLTPWFIKRIDEFEKSNKESGNGYLVVRTRANGSNLIEDYISKNKENIRVRKFDITQRNIDRIDECLKKEPPAPTIVVIKNGLRAGKTLSTTKYIKMWIDSKNSNTDTTCQSIGRCLGFEEPRGRFEDKFPIYCNIKNLNEAIDFYNDQTLIPDGIRNKKSYKNDMVYNYIMYDSVEELKKYHPNIKINAVTKISNNNHIDYAKTIVDGLSRGQSKDKTEMRVLEADGPNVNFIESWKRLEEKYPTGKYFVPKQNPESIIKNEFSEDLIKKNCMFKSKNDNMSKKRHRSPKVSKNKK